MNQHNSEQLDLLHDKRLRAFGWLIPLGLLLLSRMFYAQTKVTAIVWTIAFAWMALTCLVNATRCQRRHCFYTAPWFLLLSVITLGIARNWPIVNQLSLDLLGLVAVIVVVLLWILSEKHSGRYRNDSL